MVISKCLVCDSEIKTYPSRAKLGRGKFCSKKCKHLYTPRQEEVSCGYCSKIFMVKMSELERGGGIYCSQECFKKDYKNKHSGSNSSNWKGGSQREKHNGSYRYSDWRLKVYERDNFTCQECGIIGGKLNAHHIFSWAEYSSLRYELWNGITLCEVCHKKEHTKRRNIMVARKGDCGKGTPRVGKKGDAKPGRGGGKGTGRGGGRGRK